MARLDLDDWGVRVDQVGNTVYLDTSRLQAGLTRLKEAVAIVEEAYKALPPAVRARLVLRAQPPGCAHELFEPTTCAECPMFAEGSMWRECQHPSRSVAYPLREEHDPNKDPPPAACPLRVADAVVSLSREVHP